MSVSSSKVSSEFKSHQNTENNSLHDSAEESSDRKRKKTPAESLQNNPKRSKEEKNGQRSIVDQSTIQQQALKLTTELDQSLLAKLQPQTLQNSLGCCVNPILVKKENTGNRTESVKSQCIELIFALGLQSFVSQFSSEISDQTKELLQNENEDGLTSTQLIQRIFCEMGNILQAKESKILNLSVGAESIYGFLTFCPPILLEGYKTILSLDDSPEPELINSIADEIMLTGTKSFLESLDETILHTYMTQLSLIQEAEKDEKKKFNKDQMVNRIMDCVFELIPLDDISSLPNSVPSANRTKSGRFSQPSKKKRDLLEDSNPQKSPKSALKSSKSPVKSPSKGPSNPSKSPKTKSAPVDSSPKLSPPTVSEQPPEKSPPPTPPPKGKVEWERRPIDQITKNSTYTELYDFYNHTDLQQYAKQHGLKSADKKPILIKRILHFHATGEKEYGIKKKKRSKGTPKKSGSKANGETQKDALKKSDDGEGSDDDDNDEHDISMVDGEAGQSSETGEKETVDEQMSSVRSNE